MKHFGKSLNEKVSSSLSIQRRNLHSTWVEWVSNLMWDSLKLLEHEYRKNYERKK